MNSTIKLVHINCRSLKYKFVNIFDTINNEGIIILAINETFLKKKDNNYGFINGFNMIRLDRSYSGSGGIALIIRSNLKYKVIEMESI